MRKVLIHIGDKIEMTHVKSATRRKLSEAKYISNVLEYDGRRMAKISTPIYEGKVIPIQPGDEYNLCFYTSSGLYMSRVRVKSRFREKNMFGLVVELLNRPTKYQRRQFFRLDCVMKMRYRIVTPEEKELRDFIAASKFEDPQEMEVHMQRLEGMMGDWERATLTDISGGGVRFKCREEMKPDQLLEISVPLAFEEETYAFCCMVKVVAIANIVLKGASEIELRCQYFQIEKAKREQVVKYVFEEQRRRMRNKAGAQFALEEDVDEM